METGGKGVFFSFFFLKNAVKWGGIRHSPHAVTETETHSISLTDGWTDRHPDARAQMYTCPVHMHKHTCTHTQSCRNWLQLVGRWCLSFPHQCWSESLIIKRACLMTEGLTLSDAGTLWYSRGNPTHLHFACPITQCLPFSPCYFVPHLFEYA